VGIALSASYTDACGHQMEDHIGGHISNFRNQGTQLFKVKQVEFLRGDDKEPLAMSG
jgi:hypothetical protein